MYVSPAVRTIRDDPIPGESVTLLLETSEAGDVDELADALTDLGGTVERELEFETLEVTVAHEQVTDVCAHEGIETVETANTLAFDPDGAGEDVRPNEG